MPLRPGGVFLRLEQDLGLAPGPRAVGGTFQVSGLRQLRVVGQVVSPDTAKDRSVGQGRLGLARDAVHARLERIGADLRPGLSRVGGTEVDVAQVEPRHVVSGMAFRRPRQLLPHLPGRLWPTLDRPGRLGEADHQAAVGHRPRTAPARETGLLRRVIDRLPPVFDGDHVGRFGSFGRSRRGHNCAHPRHEPSRRPSAEGRRSCRNRGRRESVAIPRDRHPSTPCVQELSQGFPGPASTVSPGIQRMHCGRGVRHRAAALPSAAAWP